MAVACLVILIGGIDLSVGSRLALSGMVMAISATASGGRSGLRLPSRSSHPLYVARSRADDRLNMPALIATLAMMSIARGIASIITNGEQIVGLTGFQSRDHPPLASTITLR